MNLIKNVAFWLLFTTVVFSVCYFLASPLGALLVKWAVLSAGRARVLTLGLSALLTPLAMLGVIDFVKRQG